MGEAGEKLLTRDAKARARENTKRNNADGGGKSFNALCALPR